ncbi:hypothetical protein BWQ96_02821 [Gracilariopsis chorda]|uniref:Uncharacterized protein n=1 Tax=Gracilariopsis chorda TaxID=448386 RepID=A0A2V3IYY8_9FLOR|nr:hypothetical protein BWQ96_02821 [Gracilariopsis chorda]|eukprot:PXF47341.1 hypothetical protein BWQ96_02821 [Gracilariopsis chorda]
MFLDEAFNALDVAELGQRSIMVSDLSEILRSPKCSNTYVAYLPLSKVSWVSIAILCSLGSISVFWCVAAIISFFVTKDTINWNGSCDRVINLAASSDPIGLCDHKDFTAVGSTDVVMEERETYGGPIQHVHIVSASVSSQTVLGTSSKLIQRKV